MNVKKFWDRDAGARPAQESRPTEGALSHWNATRHEVKGPMVPIEDRPLRKPAFSVDPTMPTETFPCAEERLRKMLTETRVPCELCDTLLADEWHVSEDNSLRHTPTETEAAIEAAQPELAQPQTTEYEEDYEEELLPYFTESLLSYEEESNLESIYSELHHSLENIQPSEEAEEEIRQLEEIMLTPNTAPAADQPYKNFSDNALKLIGQKTETPAATLIWLASHANPHVRAAVARNSSTPSDTIIILSKDYEAGIRHCIAENPASPIQALHLLIRDRNPLIAWRAQQTLNQVRQLDTKAVPIASPKQATDQTEVHTHRPMQPATKMNEDQQNAKNSDQSKDEQRCQEHAKVKVHSADCEFGKQKAVEKQSEETVAFLQLIARKTNTPNRRLAELAANPDVRIRAAVGENANAPSEILWLLAKDPESAVKLKLVDNYNCPLEILEALREDKDEYVAYQAHTALMRIIGACVDNHIRTVTWP